MMLHPGKAYIGTNGLKVKRTMLMPDTSDNPILISDNITMLCSIYIETEIPCQILNFEFLAFYMVMTDGIVKEHTRLLSFHNLKHNLLVSDP